MEDLEVISRWEFC